MRKVEKISNLYGKLLPLQLFEFSLLFFVHSLMFSFKLFRSGKEKKEQVWKQSIQTISLLLKSTILRIFPFSRLNFCWCNKCCWKLSFYWILMAHPGNVISNYCSILFLDRHRQPFCSNSVLIVQNFFLFCSAYSFVHLLDCTKYGKKNRKLFFSLIL